MSALLILLCATVVTFALLPKRGTGGRRNLTEIVVAGLSSINIAGLLGLGWFVIEMLIHDGVMVLEILSCVILMALLTGFTLGAFAFERRGRTNTAVVLLAATAVPMIVVYGFLVYLEFNPIDWR